jgi:hypothetical protein
MFTGRWAEQPENPSRFQVDGRRALAPSTIGTLAVAAALFFAASVVAIAGGLIEVGDFRGAFRILAFGLGARFIGRAIGDFRLVGFFKRVRGTKFAHLDTSVFSPCAWRSELPCSILLIMMSNNRAEHGAIRRQRLSNMRVRDAHANAGPPAAHFGRQRMAAQRRR